MVDIIQLIPDSLNNKSAYSHQFELIINNESFSILRRN